MEKKDSVYQMVMDYIDALPVGARFHPRAIGESIAVRTSGRRNPLSGSIGRYIRYRKDAKHDVRLSSRARSEYEKIEPVEHPEGEGDDITPTTAAENARKALVASLHKDGYVLDEEFLHMMELGIMTRLSGGNA